MHPTEPSTTADAPRATRREWIGLAVIALPCLLYSMDLTVLHLAVPQLTRDLQPTGAQLLWIIDIYGFLVAGSLVTAGTLGDRIGRRKLLLIGAALFGIASVLAAFSKSAEMLIATRALLGVAGATVAPSTLSLIRNMFQDAGQRTVAISVWIMSFSLGGMLGPLVGGLLLEWFWWGSVFLIAVPIMALLLAVGPFLLPEYKDPNPGRADVTSAAMSLAAILLLIFGLKRVAQDGVGAVALLAVAAGIAVGALFVRRQLRLEEPFIDLRLFRVPRFTAALATYGLTILVLFGAFLFLPQFLQLVLGMSPFDAGLWALPGAAAFVVGSMVTPRLAQRMPLARLLSAGLALSAIGFFMIMRFDRGTGWVAYAVATAIFSLCTAPVFTLTTDLIVGAAPPERAGAASAISETCAEFGGALGIAVFGSIGVAVYRAMMPDALPAGVGAEAAVAARTTLGGALELAGQLAPDAGRALTESARTAYVRGLQLCAGISAVGVLLLAAFVARALRDVPGPAAQPAREDGAGDAAAA